MLNYATVKHPIALPKAVRRMLMPVTIDDARKGGVFHFTPAESQVDGRGKPRIERWRTNGRLKVWQREPWRFSLPIKHGLRDYSYLTDLNAHEYHREQDCPLGR